ncbi:hypothetical protein PFISCL1PPCAC_375 [Pristionchus fissidentatus]|uniref:CUB domain-containing protein n=1 Tax=Pristionchus fissidentatus TaxID=1538716 RepID=A0AAV5UQW7_9BILA|nr:hypothetical protein PFISCL1PPCAC_375 [Pristionchus fissidentatus]
MILLLAALLFQTALGCPAGYEVWFDGICSKSLSTSTMKFADAKNQCTSQNGHLPILRNDMDQNRLITSYSSIAWMWLDLSCDGQNFVWRDGTVATYTKFNGDQKCDSTSKNQIIYITTSSGVWTSTTNANENANGICELNDRSYVCDNHELVQMGKGEDTCYRVETAALHWTDAEANCETQNATLATIHDQSTNDFLRRTAVANSMMGGLLLGLKLQDNGNYSWSDGSALDYNNFAPGFPDTFYGECASMATGFTPGQWMNMDCGVTLPYICTKPAVVFNENNVPSGCPTQTEYFPGDEIFAPSWPQATGPAQCEYQLMVHNNTDKVEVELVFLESNKCCDTLSFIDGLFGSTLIRSFSGYLGYTSVKVQSTSDTMRMRWNATSGDNVRGFHVKVNAIST